MVHFFITDDTSAKEYTKEKLSQLPDTTICEARLSNETNIVYDERRASYTRLNDAEVWGFGTFFNEDGFHAAALESVTNLDELLRLLHHGLRGHYIFVISSKSGIRVIPDKIGLINVFYSDPGKRYISTDPVILSICASNTTLGEQEVKEFILNESTVGNQTLFSGTKRLGFGQEVKLTERDLNTGSIHTYSIDNLSFEKYMSRISDYFEQIDKYNGTIAADISAGFDTRTVAAVGHATIDNLSGNTNPNPNDGGADETISPKIADKLSLPLSIIEVKDGYEEEKEIMLHGTTLGRDITRSSRLPKRMEKKYDQFDLILGGYGGETLRAKYNQKSIPTYYSAERSKQLFSDTEYEQQLLSKIADYPSLDTNDQLMNLIYTIDRMRIWGGSWVTMQSIYGDTLHPFMDWYLINPVFSLSPEQLKNGSYQQQMIEYFAPQLENLPINATNQVDYHYNNMKKQMKKRLEKHEIATKIVKKILSLTGSTEDNRLVSIADYDEIDGSLFANLNIDMSAVQNSADINTVSRAYSVSAFYNYVKTESIQANR